MVRLRPKLDGPELIAAVLGASLSLFDAFIGLIAMPFAGAGPMGFLRVLSITLGFEFPVYIVSFFVSRRVLMYACWSMYVVICIEHWIFDVSENASGILAGLLGAGVSSECVVSLAVALLATYLFREERETLTRA